MEFKVTAVKPMPDGEVNVTLYGEGDPAKADCPYSFNARNSVVVAFLKPDAAQALQIGDVFELKKKGKGA